MQVMQPPRLILSALLLQVRFVVFCFKHETPFDPEVVLVYLEDDRPQPHHEAVPTSRAVPLCVHQVPAASAQSQGPVAAISQSQGSVAAAISQSQELVAAVRQ